MTTEEFKTEFASIVHWQGMVKSQANTIKRLELWDKGGTHDQAIAKAINTLGQYKTKLKNKLKGKSYDDWRQFSKNLTKLNYKIKQSRNELTRERWQEELNRLVFDNLTKNQPV